jgi:ABC-type Na+ transport system ATPase subunit NatA
MLHTPALPPQPATPVYSVQSNDELYGVAPGKIVGATGANGADVTAELADGVERLLMPNTGELTIDDIRRTVDTAIEVSRVAFVFILVLQETNIIYLTVATICQSYARSVKSELCCYEEK